MTKVIFITVADDIHGHGHLQRTNRIASSICSLYEVFIICNESTPAIKLENKMITALSFDLNNPENLFGDLLLNDEDILWFDLPDKLNYIVAKFADLKQKIVTMNMFDNRNETNFQDVFICPSFNKTRIEKDNINDVVYLTGVDFLIVPENFFLKDYDKKVPGSVLITMGGADPKGITKRLINGLKNLKRNDLTFKIILPVSLKKEEYSLPNQLKKNTKLFNFGAIDFSNEIKKTEYAIISGGMTRYECIAAKTYFIAISIHDVQYKINEHATKYGLGFNLGVNDELETSTIINYIEAMPLNPKLPDLSKINLNLKENAAARVFNTVMEMIN